MTPQPDDNLDPRASRLTSLVYISTASSAFEEDDLAALLGEARQNNAERGITGLLIYHDRSFLQVLEGPHDRLVETFERIREDRRHRAICELDRSAIESRAFPNWSMALRRPKADAHLAPPALIELGAQTMKDAGHRGDEDLAALFVRNFLKHTARTGIR